MGRVSWCRSVLIQWLYHESVNPTAKICRAAYQNKQSVFTVMLPVWRVYCAVRFPRNYNYWRPTRAGGWSSGRRICVQFSPRRSLHAFMHARYNHITTILVIKAVHSIHYKETHAWLPFPPPAQTHGDDGVSVVSSLNERGVWQDTEKDFHVRKRRTVKFLCPLRATGHRGSFSSPPLTFSSASQPPTQRRAWGSLARPQRLTSECPGD